MGNLVVLIVIYAVLLVFCLMSSYRNALMTPQFAFVVGFFVQAVFAIKYVEVWDLNLSSATMWVLGGGSILFVVVSFSTQWTRRFTVVINKKRENLGQNNSSALIKNRNESKINSLKLFLFAAFQMVTIMLIIAFLRGLSGESLADAIYVFRYANTFTEDKIAIPMIVKHMRNFCMASGYIWGYILVYDIIQKSGNNRMLLVVNIVLSGVCGVIFGSRTPLFSLLVAIVTQYLLLREKQTGKKRRLPFKYVMVCILGSIAALISFQNLGNLLGRNSTRSPMDYLAMYLSAEIKNLDTFIKAGRFGADITENQTFAVAINWLCGKIFPSDWSHELNLPFKYINGFSLGNVYTTYYSFLYDAGYVGVVIFVIFMAILSQKIYLKAIRSSKVKNDWIDLNVLAYSYMYYTILFSFFSNKFYEEIFSPRFLYYLVWWIALKFLCELKLKTRGRLSEN